jgi:hypothetical protein
MATNDELPNDISNSDILNGVHERLHNAELELLLFI